MFKKRQKMLDGESRITKCVRNNSGNIKIRGGGAPWQSRYSLQPVEDPHWNRGKEQEERSRY